MKKFLIVVDMQNDFVTGSLGTEEACAILENAAERIERFDGDIFITLDTHGEDYLSTAEGKSLPVPHCIKGTPGWALHERIRAALDKAARADSARLAETVEKPTFGSATLPEKVREAAAGEPFSLELIGLCTDICVISNALLLKAHFPEQEICVRESCVAGVTPALHKAALAVMRSCQIKIV